MKRRLCILFALLFLSGCSTTARTLKATPKAVAAVPTPFVQTVSIANPQPVKGFKIGKFTASFGDSIYYQDYVSEQTQDDLIDYSRIYRMDKLTLKSELIRQTQPYSYIYQMFTDETGSLYYCLMSFEGDGDLNYYLFRYKSDGDEIIAEQVEKVVRVDKDYIYFYMVGNDQDLYACRLSDDAILRVVDKSAVASWEDQNTLVDYAENGDVINFKITNAFIGQTKTVRVSNKAVPIHSADLNYTDSCFAYWDQSVLIVLVKDYGAGQSALYRINCESGKVLSAKKLPGDVMLNPIAYDGKLYLYSYYSDEKTNDQAIYALDIAKGGLKKVYKIKQAEDDEGLYYDAEAEAGRLFIYQVEEGDGTPVYNLATTIQAQ